MSTEPRNGMTRGVVGYCSGVPAIIRRHPITTYFGFVLLISYGSFAILDGPKLLHGQTIPAADAEYILFPIIVWGVAIAGLTLTAIVDGRQGLHDLFSRIGRWRVGWPWYAVALVTPPLLVVAVLLALRTIVSPVFTPKVFALGILFGLPGFLEEIGWMGFAFPWLRAKRNALSAAIVLGLLWGAWHAPVVDYLGAAAPHGAYWLPFSLSFVALVTAMRVLMVWVYSNTRCSILLVQLMHVSMTGSLVVLDPVRVTPAQETLWYATYAAVLWTVVGIVVARYRTGLVGQQQPMAAGSAGSGTSGCGDVPRHRPVVTRDNSRPLQPFMVRRRSSKS